MPLGRLVAEHDGAALWQGQSTLLETNQGFAYLAGAGVRVPVGIGVTLTPLRHPYYAAMEARSLALTTERPVTFGLGPGGLSFQVGLRGAPYASQLGAMRDYLTAMRQLLAGGPSDVATPEMRCAARLGTAPTAPIELGFGVLRPAMARLAGEVADTAISWLTPARYLRDVVVPALKEGAERAARPTPRLAAIVPIARRRERHEPYQLAIASNFAHSRAPHYIDMLGKAGIDVDAADPIAGARAIAAGRAFLCGEDGELCDMVQEYWDAGVDEVILNVTGVYNVEGYEAALDEIRALLDVLPSPAAQPLLVP